MSNLGKRENKCPRNSRLRHNSNRVLSTQQNNFDLEVVAQRVTQTSTFLWPLTFIFHLKMYFAERHLCHVRAN